MKLIISNYEYYRNLCIETLFVDFLKKCLLTTNKSNTNNTIYII